MKNLFQHASLHMSQLDETLFLCHLSLSRAYNVMPGMVASKLFP